MSSLRLYLNLEPAVAAGTKEEGNGSSKELNAKEKKKELKAKRKSLKKKNKQQATVERLNGSQVVKKTARGYTENPNVRRPKEEGGGAAPTGSIEDDIAYPSFYNEQEDEGGKSHDYAFYFKSPNQMMQKLETSKPLRQSKAAGRKKGKGRRKTAQAQTEAGAGFMFRWQRAKGEEDANETPADDALSPRKAISKLDQITGNLPVSSLSIAIYLGKQGEKAKVVPPRVINQALHHSSGNKQTVCPPNQFVQNISAGEGRSLSSKDSEILKRKGSKNGAVGDGEDTNLINLDGFGVTNVEEEQEGPDVVVAKLRHPQNWPPVAPRFPPPPPGEGEKEEVEPKRILKEQSLNAPKRKKSLALAGQSSSRKLSTNPNQMGDIEKKKWRRPSFLPGARSTSIVSKDMGGGTYITSCRVPWVLPPPPDPFRPPRSGSNEERRLGERETMFMFIEDLFSALVGLQLEKHDIDDKCDDLEEQIQQADETINAMLAANESMQPITEDENDSISSASTSATSQASTKKGLGPIGEE